MTKTTKKHSGKRKHKKENSNTLAGILAIVALVGSCIIMNLGGAAWGYKAGIGNLCITLFFILFWSLFPVIYKDNRVIATLSYVLCLLMCMAAACGFVLCLTNNGGFISAILVSLAAVPFFGLNFFANWTVTYGIATVFTLWWMLYTGSIVRRIKEEAVKEEQRRALAEQKRKAKKNITEKTRTAKAKKEETISKETNSKETNNEKMSNEEINNKENNEKTNNEETI